MGFGILFFSHLLMFFFKGVDVFPDVIAYAVMAWALYKLRPHAPGFRTAFAAMYAVLPLSAFSDVIQILSAAGVSLPSPLRTAAAVVTSLGLVTVYWLTLVGIEFLSNDVGRPKLAQRAVRCRILTAVYIAVMAVYSLDLPFMENFNRYVGIIYLFLGLGWVAYIGVMYYSCYMWICLEGDEDMPEDNRGFFDRILNGVRNEKKMTREEAREIIEKSKADRKKRK